MCSSERQGAAGPGSPPAPAPAVWVQVPADGQLDRWTDNLQLHWERWPPAPKGHPFATVAPPRSPPRLIQPCACVLSKGDYFKSAYFHLPWVQVNLLAGHSEPAAGRCGVVQRQPAELSEKAKHQFETLLCLWVFLTDKSQETQAK